MFQFYKGGDEIKIPKCALTEHKFKNLTNVNWYGQWELLGINM